jgi:4-hydroxy-3-methylbut-2-enyl diphosphate reductase
MSDRGGRVSAHGSVPGAYHGGVSSLPTPDTVLLARPRGFCAGVDRAVQTVERALDLYGPPVYVRKEIVHNKHVVESLRARGAVFVDELTDEVPQGAVTVFSAHGVSPAVHEDAGRRGLRTIDATCPLVTKVHREAVKFAEEGFHMILIGHAGHEEVEGTMGEAPDHITLVETIEDVDKLDIDPDTEKLAYISQTTLSVGETRDIITRLRERFTHITGPRKDDICYATTNRQAAVKELAEQCDLVLVIGSKNSSNSLRLVDVTRELGTDSYLIDHVDEVDDAWLAGRRTVGITSGASAPEELVEGLVTLFRERGTTDVRELEVVREDVRFMLPKAIRVEQTAREAVQA